VTAPGVRVGFTILCC